MNIRRVLYFSSAVFIVNTLIGIGIVIFLDFPNGDGIRVRNWIFLTYGPSGLLQICIFFYLGFIQSVRPFLHAFCVGFLSMIPGITVSFIFKGFYFHDALILDAQVLVVVLLTGTYFGVMLRRMRKEGRSGTEGI